ncbi:hypothetical protein JCM39194_24730 [Desulfotomaculum varum]
MYISKLAATAISLMIITTWFDSQRGNNYPPLTEDAVAFKYLLYYFINSTTVFIAQTLFFGILITTLG